jgi:hypothetical protein
MAKPGPKVGGLDILDASGQDVQSNVEATETKKEKKEKKDKKKGGEGAEAD